MGSFVPFQMLLNQVSLHNNRSRYNPTPTHKPMIPPEPTVLPTLLSYEGLSNYKFGWDDPIKRYT